MYSCLTGSFPKFVNNFFTDNSALHNFNTRKASALHISYKRTNCGKFSLRYRGVEIWNSLPQDLKKCKSYNCDL